MPSLPKKTNDDKLKAKLNTFSGFFSFEVFPHLGTRKGIKKKSSTTLNQSSDNGPSSLADPIEKTFCRRKYCTFSISVKNDCSFKSIEDQEFSSLNHEIAEEIVSQKQINRRKNPKYRPKHS